MGTAARAAIAPRSASRTGSRGRTVHKGVRTTNGDIWPESLEATSARCNLGTGVRQKLSDMNDTNEGGRSAMMKRSFSMVMFILVIGLAAPSASAACWKCTFWGSRVMCDTTDSTTVGKNFCSDSSQCQASGCTSSCQTTGLVCTGGSAGNCGVMVDGTVICEEHKSVHTINGETWPESGASTSSSVCSV